MSVHTGINMIRIGSLALAGLLCGTGNLESVCGAESEILFGNEKTSWHGFDRYDFVMDEANLGIRPTKAADDEGDAIRHTVEGLRRCVVVVPKVAAPGKPWSWRGCYWDHQPQSEIELLQRGFHIAYIEASPTLRPGRHWDAWYAFLTEKHGLSAKPAFVGMSRGGEFAFTWATASPGHVSCIYADNPGSNPEVFSGLRNLALKDVPLLLVCGSIDPLLEKNALAIENIYHQFGGRVSVMIKEGAGHHPHSLRDPKRIADFVERSARFSERTFPQWVTTRASRNSFYGIRDSYRSAPTEGTFITCRGPEFSECYDRYTVQLPGIEGAMTVIAPVTERPGRPWVFRADFVRRDSSVDLALLGKGFHVVTGPVPYNADGPKQADWDTVYSYLVTNGFAAKPVMAGAGAATGEAYAWAIDNPAKVACIYGENPVLHSSRPRRQPLDNLAPLASAGVPVLHLCGSLDPHLKGQTYAAQERYRECGGQFAVLVEERRSHYPLAPEDPTPVVDFIMANVEGKPGDIPAK